MKKFDGKVNNYGHFKPVSVTYYDFVRGFFPGEMFWLLKKFNPVKRNRRRGLNKPRVGGNISLKSIDERARLLGSLE